jgi:hypothetical protein
MLILRLKEPVDITLHRKIMPVLFKTHGQGLPPAIEFGERSIGAVGDQWMGCDRGRQV